jgi:hypothetical protein
MALSALSFAFRGDARMALTRLQEAIALAEKPGHDVSLAQPLTQLPWAHQINGVRSRLLERRNTPWRSRGG